MILFYKITQTDNCVKTLRVTL